VTIPDPFRHPSFALFRDHDRWEELLALYTLAEHGGIWLHPTVHLQQPLHHWLFPRDAEVAGFYSERTTLLDKRCIACNKESPFIQQWKSAYLEMARHPSVHSFLLSLPPTSLPAHLSTADEVMALALHHTLQETPYPMESVILRPLEKGPIKHILQAKGDKKKATYLAEQSDEPILFL
jgi:hypothetical protein